MRSHSTSTGGRLSWALLFGANPERSEGRPTESLPWTQVRGGRAAIPGQMGSNPRLVEQQVGPFKATMWPYTAVMLKWVPDVVYGWKIRI